MLFHNFLDPHAPCSTWILGHVPLPGPVRGGSGRTRGCPEPDGLASPESAPPNSKGVFDLKGWVGGARPHAGRRRAAPNPTGWHPRKRRPQTRRVFRFEGRVGGARPHAGRRRAAPNPTGWHPPKRRARTGRYSPARAPPGACLHWVFMDQCRCYMCMCICLMYTCVLQYMYACIYPAACGKSRHRASPTLWVATLPLTTAMAKTTMTMRGEWRRRRKAVTCGAFRFYVVRSSHGAPAVWGSRGAVWGPLWALLGRFRASWAVLGALLGRLGVLLAVWEVFGPSGGRRGALLGRLGSFRRPSGASWRLSWGPLGPSMNPLGPSGGRLGRTLAHSGALFGPLGAILESSWAVFS